MLHPAHLHHTPRRLALLTTLLSAVSVCVDAAAAQDVPTSSIPAEVEQKIQNLQKLIDAASQRIADQEQELEKQKELINVLLSQQRQAASPVARDAAASSKSPSSPLDEAPLETIRAGAAQATAAAPAPAPQAAASVPDQPVGEAPDQPNPAAEVAVALPENLGVLTPPLQLTIEPSIEYDRSSTSRLVFRGVQIIPGINLGLVDASDVARDAAIAAVDVRAGITNRIELQARVPYMYRHDLLTSVSQPISPGQPGAIFSQDLEGHGIGDLEFGTRLQLNPSTGTNPIFLATYKVRAPTGTGPFDVPFDSNGIAQDLAMGSGFWGVASSASVLMPLEPVVLFGNFGFTYNFAEDIDKTIGTTLVGKVTPGSSLNAGLGFGFSLNPSFSFSLGYAHTTVLPTKTELGATLQKSRTLQSGALTLGWSYTHPGFTLSNNFEFGVTSDAPDLRIVFRTPFSVSLAP